VWCLDYQCFIHSFPFKFIADIMELKMQALSERTGAHIVMFMTQGHVDDQIMPGWFATSRSIHFFMDSLNLSGWDVLRLMEQWACVKSASMSSFSLPTPHAYKKTSLSSA
jgi:hypothetical protein